MKLRARITEAEWRLMKLLWARSPLTAQDLAQATAKEWSESTVKTLLNRLVRKGALEHRKVGKAFLYSPAVSEEDCRALEGASFIERVFGGSLSPMIAHFVESGNLTDDELADLERMVRRKRRKQ